MGGTDYGVELITYLAQREARAHDMAHDQARDDLF